MPYVYMIKDENGKLYIGVSEQPEERLQAHNAKQGSVFTKSGKFKIVFQEAYQTLTLARQREIQIKNWRREKKEMLIVRYKQGLSTKL